MSENLLRKNKLTLYFLLILIVAMISLSFASVPLYRLFCQVTGFGGTTQVAKISPDIILNKKITVQFLADTDMNLPWEFEPLQKKIDVKIGQSALIYYRAKNLTNKTLVGHAVYNVTPLKAGAYFQKIECFCFENQPLNAGQEVEMPVYFYIDPEIMEDPNLSDVKVITLSYNFFKAKEE